MCSAMNSSETNSVHNTKGTKNFYINAPYTHKFDTDDIPYLSEPLDKIVDETTEEQKRKYSQYKMEINDNDELNLSILSNWIDSTEDEAGYQDDNMSHVGSDYSEIQATEHDNPFAQPIPSDVAYGSSGGEMSDSDIKCNPPDLMLRPPSGSAMHFSYKFPAISSQNGTDPAAVTPAMQCNTQVSYTYSSQQDINSSTVATPVASTSNYPTNTHSNGGSGGGGFQPNMWYPNAPFGTSYRSYGSQHSYGRHYGAQVSREHMMDMFQLSNSGREARNRAEKNRRDKLNGSIQELSTMVPHVAESPRRVDKTAVLRFAAHGLRLKYVFGKSLNNHSTQTTDALMKLLDSFFLTLTCNGQIVLASSSIEQHLGHCQADLYGQNILHITHPEDHQMIKEKLIPKDLDNLFDIQPEDESGEPRQRTQSEEDEIDRRLREDKRNFTIRLARSGPRSEPTIYELVKVEGSFRRSDMAPRGLKTSTFPSTLQLMRRSRGREDFMPLHTISGNDIVLVAIARIVRPPVINRTVEANRLEYKTRHLIDGRIIECDQRIGLVAGYMTDEVRNLSPFTFIHQDDVRWVIVALRQMYDCNSSYGESTYRLFTRSGNFIYLHTKGFLEIDKNTNQVHSFICVNTLLDEEEGKRRVEHMKKKFSVIINTQIPQASNDDVPASENPQQLEKAVLCLIQNLKSGLDDDNDIESSTRIQQNATHNNPNTYLSSSSPQTSVVSRSTAETPPLDLVPPAADSIKNSISKSVSVVNTAAGKFLRSNTDCVQKQQSVHEMHCVNESEEIVCDLYDMKSTTGAVKRKMPCSITEIDDDDDEYRVPTQRQAIENVLSDSLKQINNRLNQQLNTAMELRDQSQRYEVPHTEERIADIMKEHQKQQEMYKNISNEFEVQRKNNESDCGDSQLIRQNTFNTNGLQEAQPQQIQQENSNLSVPSETIVTTTVCGSNSIATDAQLNSNNNNNS